MHNSEYDFDGTSIFNVMQIIALNAAASGAGLIALRAVGSSWSTAVLGGWLGGSVATIGVIAGSYWLHTALHARNRGFVSESAPQFRRKGDAGDTRAELVPADVTDPLQVWETDRLLELDHYISKTGGSSDAPMSGSIDRTEMEQMWHDDAAAEAEEARLACERRAQSDRRRASSGGVAPERRRAQRRG